MLGAGLAGAMVVMGLVATFLAIRIHMVPSFFPKGVFLVMNAVGILVFGGIVANRHRSCGAIPNGISD